jgi:hypothetical protein
MQRILGFQACSAFAFITIPSLSDSSLEIALALEAAEASFFTRCLGQGCDLVRFAIKRVVDCERGLMELQASLNITLFFSIETFKQKYNR